MADQSIVSAAQRSSERHEHVDMAMQARESSEARSHAYNSSLADARTKPRQVSSTLEPWKKSQTPHDGRAGIRRTKDLYKVDKTSMYVNNLMWQVGLLELSNAMDFPANIWNQIPTPLFAAILMGIGGSIAILWSVFPYLDMRKSLANIRLLRGERRFLKQWQREMDDNDTLETRCLVQAWLDVNFREIGWECIDRVLMDVCAGISGVLVGAGALMAIRGDIDDVFLASNLLSGYIGNSFLAPYALMNTIWAVFMWMRAGGEKELLHKGKVQVDVRLQAQMQHHRRKHKLYAVVNGCTALVGTVGGIMSATLWYGYVVIAPAVFTAVFCNLFWRYRMGYDRKMIECKQDLLDFDLLHTLQAVQAAIGAAKSGRVHELGFATAKTSEDVCAYLAVLGLQDALNVRLLGEQGGAETSQTAGFGGQGVAEAIVAAKETIISEQNGILRSQERFLIEVYGRYFRRLETTV